MAGLKGGGGAGDADLRDHGDSCRTSSKEKQPQGPSSSSDPLAKGHRQIQPKPPVRCQPSKHTLLQDLTRIWPSVK